MTRSPTCGSMLFEIKRIVGVDVFLPSEPVEEAL